MKKDKYSFSFLSLKLYYRILYIFIFIMSYNSLNASLFEHTLRIVQPSENSAQVAKQESIKRGREESLLFVLSKMTSIESQDQIKELLKETSAVSFERGFSLNNELITERMYAADATFIFDEEKIRRFLEHNNIPYLFNINIGRYLIIPLYYHQGSLVSNNIWSNYWSGINSQGDNKFLSNFIYYNNTDILESENRLLSIKENLQLDGIFILSLFFESSESFSLEIIDAISKEEIVFNNVTSVQEATMLTPAVIEENKKQSVLDIYKSNYFNETIKVTYNKYEDWIFIEEVINSMIENSSFHIESIGNNYVNISLSFIKNSEEVRSILESQCIIFDTSGLEIFKNEELC